MNTAANSICSFQIAFYHTTPKNLFAASDSYCCANHGFHLYVVLLGLEPTARCIQSSLGKNSTTELSPVCFPHQLVDSLRSPSYMHIFAKLLLFLVSMLPKSGPTFTFSGAQESIKAVYFLVGSFFCDPNSYGFQGFLGKMCFQVMEADT